MQNMIVVKTTKSKVDEILNNHVRYVVLKDSKRYHIDDYLFLQEYDKYGDFTGRVVHGRISHIACPVTLHNYSILSFTLVDFYELQT